MVHIIYQVTHHPFGQCSLSEGSSSHLCWKSSWWLKIDFSDGFQTLKSRRHWDHRWWMCIWSALHYFLKYLCVLVFLHLYLYLFTFDESCESSDPFIPGDPLVSLALPTLAIKVLEDPEIQWHWQNNNNNKNNNSLTNVFVVVWHTVRYSITVLPKNYWVNYKLIMPSKMEVASHHCGTVRNKTKDIFTL